MLVVQSSNSASMLVCVWVLQVARDYRGLAALVKETKTAFANARDLKGTTTLAYYPDGRQVLQRSYSSIVETHDAIPKQKLEQY